MNFRSGANGAIFAKISGKIDKITAIQNVNVLLFFFLKVNSL